MTNNAARKRPAYATRQQEQLTPLQRYLLQYTTGSHHDTLVAIAQSSGVSRSTFYRFLKGEGSIGSEALFDIAMALTPEEKRNGSRITETDIAFLQAVKETYNQQRQRGADENALGG